MAMPDGSAGSPGDRTAPQGGLFPPTSPSLLRRAASPSEEIAGKALSELCEIYWPPLYVFARSRGCAPEDAEDLTQGFLSRFLERNDFEAADLSKGKLRSFLLVSMKNYMAAQFRKAACAKRGGGIPIVSIDHLEAEQRYGQLPSDELTPDLAYDRQWATTLLQRVMAKLQSDYEARGKRELFEAIHDRLPLYTRGQPYAEAAARLGLNEGTLKVYAHRMRERYRELLRQEIAHTVPDESSIDAEISELFSLFS